MAGLSRRCEILNSVVFVGGEIEILELHQKSFTYYTTSFGATIKVGRIFLTIFS